MPAVLSAGVGPWTGSTPTQTVTMFDKLAIRDSLIDGPQVSWTMPSSSPAALITDGLATDVWVYMNGTLWQRCRVLPVAQQWGTSGEDDATITAVGYKTLLAARYLHGDLTYTSTDEGLIIAGLINHAQAQTNGSLGITVGTPTTGTVRDRTFISGDNLGTLLEQLSNVSNGPWWGLTPAGQLVVRKFSSFAALPAPLRLGTNVRKLQRTPGRTFANAVGAVGSREQTVPVWVQSAGIATDPRGRWEYFDSGHGSVIIQATVTEIANGDLGQRQYPPAAWTIEIEPARWIDGEAYASPGMFARVVVPKSAVDEIGPPAVSRLVQITDVSVTLDNAGRLEVTYAAIEVST